MNSHDATKLFAQALDDKLSGEQLAQFEAALTADDKLRAEFEAFSDLRGGNLANIHSWLLSSGEASRRHGTSVDSRITDDLVEQVRGRRSRGRIIQFALGGLGLAAAAAITVVLLLPASPVEPSHSGTNLAFEELNRRGAQLTSAGTRVAVAPIEARTDSESRIELAVGSVFQTLPAGSVDEPSRLRLFSGRAQVRLKFADQLSVEVGPYRIHAVAPSEFDVIVSSQAADDPLAEAVIDYDRYARPRRIARDGASELTLTISVVHGSVELRQGRKSQTLKPGAGFGPEVIQAQPQAPQPEPRPKPGQPPKPEDVFEHLDKNNDGKLDEDEFGDPGHTDFDDNKDGKISLDEFKKHFKPPQSPPPEEAFKRQDKNDDGKLDATEIEQRAVDQMDEDKNGTVSLEEFRKHFKPKAPRPEDEFAKLDKNSDGKLDASETNQRMVDEFDDNKDGKVDLDEFKAHWRPPQPGPRPEDEFNRLDKNKDGKLDNGEVEQPMIDDFDKNNDGKIDLDEFKERARPQGPRQEDEFKRMDRNDDGALDKVELPDDAMREYLDKNKDGKVDVDEWREGRKPENLFKFFDKNSDGKLDGSEIDEGMMRAHDTNKDGTVDAEEFKRPPKPPRAPGPPGPPGPGPGDGPKPPRGGPRPPR